MRFRRPLAVTALLAGALPFLGDASRPSPTHPRLFPAPPIILWAWEEPEDLRTLDPRHAGVAFLAERIFLGSETQFLPRHQRISVPEDIWAEAVVRIETRPGFRDTDALRAQTAKELLRVASLPHISSFQIDFDAAVSQHAFYADVLHRVRAGLAPSTRLTMTALISWCSAPDGWLSTLPLDAAVPMYFRLGKHAGSWPVREPLCSTTLGLSTDEPSAAAIDPAKRLYLFAPRPWTTEQLSAINSNKPSLAMKGER